MKEEMTAKSTISSKLVLPISPNTQIYKTPILLNKNPPEIEPQNPQSIDQNRILFQF